jgi:membrane-bound metal-dependent hydrolase YbcI (DUF457 family)
MKSRRLFAVLAAVIIGLCDRGLSTRPQSKTTVGLLDESAHIATTVLLLAPARLPTGSPVVRTALPASVIIDLDHVPQYMGSERLTEGTPRPYPHSWVTLGAAGALAATSRRRREHALGAVLGLSSHLFRDLALPRSNPGIAFLWPFSKARVSIPYRVYGGVLGAALALTLTRG